MKNLFILTGILAVLFFIAIFPMPGGYYIFLRVVVSIGSAFYAIHSYKHNNAWMCAVWIIIFALFQPVFRVSFSHTIWTLIDFVCGLISGFYSYSQYIATHNHTRSNN